jgi:hypothetical protein
LHTIGDGEGDGDGDGDGSGMEVGERNEMVDIVDGRSLDETNVLDNEVAMSDEIAGEVET